MNPRVVVVALVALGIVGVAGLVGFLMGRSDHAPIAIVDAGPLPPPPPPTTTTAPTPTPTTRRAGPGPVPPESASDERKLAWLLAACPKAPCTDDAKLFAGKFRRTRSNGDKAMLHTALESCLRACAGPR